MDTDTGNPTFYINMLTYGVHREFLNIYAKFYSDNFSINWNGEKIDFHRSAVTTQNRTDSRLAPSQWEMLLQSNAVSHWLGTNLESALQNHCWNKPAPGQRNVCQYMCRNLCWNLDNLCSKQKFYNFTSGGSPKCPVNNNGCVCKLNTTNDINIT